MTPSPSAETPQQPELTQQDKKVIDTIIDNHYAIHIAPTQLDLRLRHIAETVMLHERAAAQARIKELEALTRHIDTAYELVFLMDDHFRNVIASGDYTDSDMENHKKGSRFIKSYQKYRKP